MVASSIVKLPDDAFVSAATDDAYSMVNLVCLFMKPHLLALLQQDNCLELLHCFLAHVVWMCKEYNSVLSTPTEANKISYCCQYRYIGKTQISADISVDL